MCMSSRVACIADGHDRRATCREGNPNAKPRAAIFVTCIKDGTARRVLSSSVLATTPTLNSYDPVTYVGHDSSCSYVPSRLDVGR